MDSELKYAFKLAACSVAHVGLALLTTPEPLISYGCGILAVGLAGLATNQAATHVRENNHYFSKPKIL